MNSAGVGRNFMEVYPNTMLPKTNFLWVPSDLNNSVMGSGVGVCGSVWTIVVIGAGQVDGAVEARVVCGSRGTARCRTRVGRHKLVGKGVSVEAGAATYSLVAVAALVTWLGSPTTK